MLRIAKNVLSWLGRAPIVSDYRRHYWSFYRYPTEKRGLFKTFAEAESSLRGKVPVGYDPHAPIPASEVANITAMRDLGAFAFRDYPVLFWLQRALRRGNRVFNIGGNIGVDYFSFVRRLPEIAFAAWTICDVPNVIACGREIADSKRASAIRFTARVDDGDGCNAIVCIGTLQYLPYNLPEIISRWTTKPNVVIIANTPVRDGEGFVTTQNIGFSFVPYRVFSRQELEEEYQQLGYELVDEWQHPQHLSVPFARELTLDHYSGFVFERKTRASSELSIADALRPDLEIAGASRKRAHT